MPQGASQVPEGERIRLIEASDLGRLMQLSRQVGFNQTGADWERLLYWDPQGCFAAVHDNRIVATTTTTSYSPGLAWIGMVIVDESFRRLGIGSRLVEHALRHLESVGVRRIALDATTQGKQVYDRYGFRDQYEVHRMQGVATPVSNPEIVSARRMTAADLPGVTAMDAATLGVARPELLDQLFRANPAGCSVVEEDGTLIAWSFRRAGAHRWHIGPIVARDQAAADVAFHAAVSAIPGEPIEIDVIEGSQHAHLADRFQLSTARSFTRMVFGDDLPPAAQSHCYATAAPELG
jgi:GNAT superfamily N-acetyltransferase